MSQPPDDDDPTVDWQESAPTLLDGVVEIEIDPDTERLDLSTLASSAEAAAASARDEGCRACYGEGQEDVLGALRSILLERGLTNDETTHLVLAVRQRLTSYAAAEPI